MLFWLSPLWHVAAILSVLSACVGVWAWFRHRYGCGKLYGSGVDTQPEDTAAVADAFMNLGRCLHENQAFESAVVLYNRALDIHPDVPLARLNRDRALAKVPWTGGDAGVGQTERAAPAAQEQAKVQPAKDIRPQPAPEGKAALSGALKALAEPPVPKEHPAITPREPLAPAPAPSSWAPLFATSPQKAAVPASPAPVQAREGEAVKPPAKPAAPLQRPLTPSSAKAPVRSDSLAMLQQARKLLQNREFDKAIGILDAILGEEAENSEALSTRGEAFLQKNLFSNAVRDFSASLKINPQSADVLNSRGIALARMGKAEEAARDFQALSQLDPARIGSHPAHAELLLSQAVMQFRLESFDKALEHLEKVLDLTPGNSQARMYRGMVYDRKGMLDEAIRDFDQVVESAPRHAEACWRRAEVYMRKNLYRNAIEDFNKALERDPLCAEALHGRGRIAARKGQHREAIEDFSRALERLPDNADILFARGLELKMEGKFRSAMEDFQAACDHGRIEALAEYEKLKNTLEKAVAGGAN